jgi:hypothetical protein
MSLPHCKSNSTTVVPWVARCRCNNCHSLLLAIAIAFTTTTCVHGGVPYSNDVTVTIDKDYYSTFQHVTCQLSGLEQVQNDLNFIINFVTEYTNDDYFLYTAKRDNIRVVQSFQLANRDTNINDLIDNADFLHSYLGILITDNNNVTVTVAMNNELIIGPEYYDRYNYNQDNGERSDNGRTNITILNSTYTSGPYQCIVINNNKTSILGVSKQFIIGPPKPVTINYY